MTNSENQAARVDDAVWAERCFARLCEHDPLLRQEEASSLLRELVQDLIGLDQCRAMVPEVAADVLFTGRLAATSRSTKIQPDLHT